MAPQEFLDNCPSLNPEDIADGVLYVLGAPSHVQVSSKFSKLILIFNARQLY
jgi:NADP-dependent 3-hydroxy acid dehydrogenase YdfG